MKAYIITAYGKAHRFATLEAALKCANEIFASTGVVVGIEIEN